MTATDTSTKTILARLHDLLGADGVETEASERLAAGYDALGHQRGFAAPASIPPIAVARPSTRDEVAAVVRVARESGVPVVPQGGASGLMGGARTTSPAIVLDLKRMARVREIDAVSRMAWLEAGAVLKDVDDALRPHGLMIGHDPWTYSIATVGGAISTNGLGFLGGKYGSMGDQVLGLEVVLADGSLLDTAPVQPKSTGIDLTRLFVGGEGQYGIITAAALRVFPIPESRVRIGYTFATFEDGFAALIDMHRAGLAPAMLDFGERPAAPDGVGWTVARDAEPPTLYLGFEGLREEVAALLTRASVCCEQHDAKALPEGDVEAFWDERHAPAENFARTRSIRREQNVDPSGQVRCFDYVHVSLPPSRVLEYRRRALAIAVKHDVFVLEAGLWATPGLFSLAMANVAPSLDEAVSRMSAMVDECLRAANAMGGSMEYCHGAGLRLAHLMREEHGRGLDVMRAIKGALDSSTLLNPGKMAGSTPASD